jgi:hypothetical protein
MPSIKKVQANKQEHEKVLLAKAKGSVHMHMYYYLQSPDSSRWRRCCLLLDTEGAAAKASAAAVDHDPFADVVASDRDILAQYEPSADADVVF